jgi:hypothetical protein
MLSDLALPGLIPCQFLSREPSVNMKQGCSRFPCWLSVLPSAQTKVDLACQSKTVILTAVVIVDSSVADDNFPHRLTVGSSEKIVVESGIQGAPAGLDEIGDVCNLRDEFRNGLNVESCWSISDNACVIPTAWSARRTLAGD